MDQLTLIIKDINSILWGPFVLIPILVGVGIFFTLRLRFVQIRLFCRAIKQVFRGLSLKGEQACEKKGMSSFQSLATAVAAQVGTGNLAGVATAMVLGGPGAIFWMWLAAFFGMATIFAEAILAQLYRTHDKSGHITGGPSYYIHYGLGSKPLAIFFSISIVCALGFVGNMVQANSISFAFNEAFAIPNWITSAVLVFLAGFVFIGGIKRIASFTEKLVPLMALIYVLGAIFIMICFADKVLPSLWQIIYGAFNPEAATGGVIGASIKEAIRYGVARGLFSNEAGMGSTPHAHAVARVKHPAEQGLAAIIGLFVDTFVVLNATALVILVTSSLDGQTTGIALTQAAFVKGMGSLGSAFVAICLFFAAFTTIIGWYFFAKQNVNYLFGIKALKFFNLLVLAFIFVGAFLNVTLVWEIADLFNGIMVIPNIIAVIGLYKLVAKVASDFEHNYLRGEAKIIYGDSHSLTDKIIKDKHYFDKLSS